MKKLVFASVVALASLGFVAGPTLHAQEAGQIQLPPEQYNAYQLATTQTDPAAKAKGLEDFLTKFPQSPVKQSVLDQLLDAYQQSNQPDKTLDAATRLLQVDPNNLKAILYSVLVKKAQCGKNSDAATCDDAAALAQKGLGLTKPAATSDDDWKKLTTTAYPIFHSAIAFDDALSKKDFKGAQDEFTAELKMYTDEQSKQQ